MELSPPQKSDSSGARSTEFDGIAGLNDGIDTCGRMMEYYHRLTVILISKGFALPQRRPNATAWRRVQAAG